MKRTSPIGTERGVALLAAVFLVVVIGFLGMIMVSLIGTQSFSGLNELLSTNSFYVAEGGIERAMYQYRAGTSCAGLTGGATPLGGGSFTTVGTLYRPAGTTLSAGINNNVTAIPVASTAGYAPHGRIRIDNEWIDYTGTTANSFTGARRASGGSAAAAHANNARVFQRQCLIRSTGAAGGSRRTVERAVPMDSLVQSGTESIAVNGTVAVNLPSAVDPARAFLLFNTRHNNNRPVGSYLRGRIASPTTIEFARVTNEGGGMPPINVQWYVVEYESGVRVQRGEVAQSNTTVNVGIAAVSALNRAFVTWSKTATNTDVEYAENDPILGELTSTTNLQFQVDQAANTHIIWWQVVEFTTPNAALVQKGTTSLTAGGGSSLARTISPGTLLTAANNAADSFVLIGFRTSGNGTDVGARMLRAQIDGNGRIVIDRSITGGEAITEVVWQAVTLRDGSVVQGGSESFAVGDGQETVAIAAVDPDRSAAFASAQPVNGQSMGRSPSVANVIGVGSATLALTADQLTIDRNFFTGAASSADLGWFVVQFGSGGTTGPRPPIDWVELVQ